MIAIPVTNNDIKANLDVDFTMASFFALVKDKKNQTPNFFKNSYTTKEELLSFLKENEVEKIVFYALKPELFDYLLDNGIELYYAGDEVVNLEFMIETLFKNRLLNINHDNKRFFLMQSELYYTRKEENEKK
jgi:predicted Fe-Mo cluster-binding NifX family protein